MKPLLKYVDLGSYCTLQTGSDDSLYRRYGTENVRFIRPATEQDVEWVRAMGGSVPDSYRLEKKEKA